jgi:hypothetical protein
MDFWNQTTRGALDRYTLTSNPWRIVVYRAIESECPAPGCGWDEFSGSAKKVDCTFCGGVGKVITWNKYAMRARATWSPTELRYINPTPGIEMGDCTLVVSRRELAVIEQVMQSERSYILVDGKAVRPTHTSPCVLPGITEGYLVNCNLITPAVSGT